MSVLLEKRMESKAEYVNTANEIYAEAINFLSKMSERYARIFVPEAAKLAGTLMDQCEAANKIFPSDDTRKDERKRCLLRAQGTLAALDTEMLHIYAALWQNPEGCFITASGRKIGAAEAKTRLDNMSQSLGEKIKREDDLLKKVLESDRKR